MLLSEVIMAANDEEYDIRGDMLNDDTPCTMYHDDQHAQQRHGCVAVFIPTPAIAGEPAVHERGFGHSHKAARSRHPGGVNVIMADCSMRFVTDDIALATWRAMGTMNGGEVISEGK